MKYLAHVTWIFLISLLFSQNVVAEWQKRDTVYAVNSIVNTFGNSSLIYNPHNKCLYLTSFFSYGEIHVFDTEIQTGIEKITVENTSSPFYSSAFDEERNLLYVAGYSGISVIDCNTNSEINGYYDEQELNIWKYNPHTFYLDISHRIIYITTIKNPDEIQYLVAINASTMKEIFRFEIPTKGDKDCGYYNEAPRNTYRALYVDDDTQRLYLGFDTPAPEPDDHTTFYLTHEDSLYVFDLLTKNMIKTIPVGARPRYMIKNHSDGLIYVNCQGIYADGFDYNFFDNEKGILSIIDSNSIEIKENIIINKKARTTKIEKSVENNHLYIAGAIFSMKNNKFIGSFDSIHGSVTGIDYDEISDIIYMVINGNMLKAFDIDGSLLFSSETGTSSNMAYFSPLQNALYYAKNSSEKGQKIGVLDITEKKLLVEKKLERNRIERFIVNESNNLLYFSLIGNGEFCIGRYDINNNIYELGTSIPYDGLSLTDRLGINEVLNRFYVLLPKQDTFESSLMIFDTETLDLIETVELGLLEPQNLLVNTINHKIYVKERFNEELNTERNTILIIDGLTNNIILRKEIVAQKNKDRGHYKLNNIILDPEDNLLYAHHRLENKITIYNANNLEEMNMIEYSSHIDGHHLILCKKSDELFVSDGYRFLFYNLITGKTSTEYSLGFGLWFPPEFNTNTGTIIFINNSTFSAHLYKNPDIAYLPPSAPPSLTTTPTESAITITWPPVDNEDVQGYKVYRSSSGSDQWTKLNTELVTHTSFLDETAVPNTPYDYHVRTTGLYNISSDPSETVTATLTIDPGFSLSSILSSQSTEQGTSIDFIITSESIEQFATLIDLTVENLPEDLPATLSTAQLRPGDVASLTLDIPANITPGTYDLEVVGNADGIEHRVPLSLNVVETEQQESAITLSLSSNSIEFGDAIFASGRIIPEVSAPVSLVFTSASETKTVTTTSLSDGTFSLDFEPETSGEWTVQASWAGSNDFSGATSELTVFEALSGQTKITCTTDVSADAEVGWQMTVKGTVFPNPGVGDVVLYVTKPDGTKDTIDGLKINELGYYGYNITADQPGFWEVTAGWAGNSRYLGAVSETLVVPYGLDIGRAVIVVSPKQNRPFYYTANRLGNLAYQTFSKRRFDNPRIKYFDIDTTQDLNGDGFTGDVDGEPTLENVTEAISTWSAAAVNEETPLCIYLIGEGSLDGIELSDGNLLTASYLAELLSDVETTTGCDDVIVVVDAPHSGKFVSELSKLGRCVVTSTNLGKSNYIGHGKLSFSQYFLNYAYQGKSLRDSFLYTKRVLSNLPGAFKKQKPQVEGEGNLFANESSDFLKTANWYFGSSYGLQDLMPRVKSMSLASVTGQGGGVGKIVTNTHNILSDERTPSLKLAKSVAAQGVDVWVRVDDAESNISSVFATVFSPQDSVLQEVELFDNDLDGKYEGVVYGLDDIGAYDIVAYAFDESENVSEPMKSLVMVVEREIVLVPPTNVSVSDVPGDNGHQVNVSWGPSPSEDEGDVGWYRIYRSRKNELTSPIPLSQFTNLDTLKVYEESYTILVDSVAVGQTEFVDSVPLNGVNYYYWVQAIGSTGASKKVAADTPTFVVAMPTGFIVHQPYPNPFNPTTTIRYELPVGTHVEFVVYDVLGRKVKVLEDRMQEAGAHDIVWDGIDERGNGVGSGMYFYQVKAGDVVMKGKMVLVR